MFKMCFAPRCKECEIHFLFFDINTVELVLSLMRNRLIDPFSCCYEIRCILRNIEAGFRFYKEKGPKDGREIILAIKMGYADESSVDSFFSGCMFFEKQTVLDGFLNGDLVKVDKINFRSFNGD